LPTAHDSWTGARCGSQCVPEPLRRDFRDQDTQWGPTHTGLRPTACTIFVARGCVQYVAGPEREEGQNFQKTKINPDGEET
jgi:hypothetical protein